MEEIVEVSAVDEDGYLFTVRSSEGDKREAFLVMDDGGDVHAWFNYCQHITTINIDKGSGLPRRGDQVVCQNHGAMFNIDDGLCTHGPCEGATLESLSIKVRDGTVYLNEEDYQFVEAGGLDDGTASSSRGEFF